jgi:hypothetical protein
VLRRQIKQLDQKLAQLTREREQAAAAVEAIKARREWIRNNAPKWLVNQVHQELLMVRQTDDNWQRSEQLDARIRQIQSLQINLSNTSNSLIETDRGFLAYCELHYPEAVDREGSRPRVRPSILRQHADALEKEIPQLQRERQEALAAWSQTVAEIESSLTRWINTGEILD